MRQSIYVWWWSRVEPFGIGVPFKRCKFSSLILHHIITCVSFCLKKKKKKIPINKESPQLKKLDTDVWHQYPSSNTWIHCPHLVVSGRGIYLIIYLSLTKVVLNWCNKSRKLKTQRNKQPDLFLYGGRLKNLCLLAMSHVFLSSIHHWTPLFKTPTLILKIRS